MIVVLGGSRVLFESKHVIILRIKGKVLARENCLTHNMRLKRQDRRAHGSEEGAHPQVQTEASNRTLSRHVSHPRKRNQTRFQAFFFSTGAAGFAGGVLGSTVSVCGKYS